jgi:hypothetical protein
MFQQSACPLSSHTVIFIPPRINPGLNSFNTPQEWSGVLNCMPDRRYDTQTPQGDKKIIRRGVWI